MVGKIVTKLSETGLDQITVIIFSSDHGECFGDRGFWTKMVMYEEAASIPIIMLGSNISPWKECAPVSLIDLYPTILEIAGIKRFSEEAIHARSLFETLNRPDKGRLILSECHDYGAQTGMFMLRHENWKLIHYPGFEPQLLNLEKDPEEEENLADDKGHTQKLEELSNFLKVILDPDGINKLAFRDQEDMIRKLGGREEILAMQNYDHTPVNEI